LQVLDPIRTRRILARAAQGGQRLWRQSLGLFFLRRLLAGFVFRRVAFAAPLRRATAERERAQAVFTPILRRWGAGLASLGARSISSRHVPPLPSTNDQPPCLRFTACDKLVRVLG